MNSGQPVRRQCEHSCGDSSTKLARAPGCKKTPVHVKYRANRHACFRALWLPTRNCEVRDPAPEQETELSKGPEYCGTQSDMKMRRLVANKSLVVAIFKLQPSTLTLTITPTCEEKTCEHPVMHSEPKNRLPARPRAKPRRSRARGHPGCVYSGAACGECRDFYKSSIE